MTERAVTVTNPLGVHARPSALLVQTASKFQSDIWFVKDGQEVNGKSMLGVMTLAAEMGSTVVIRANGPDEERAVEELAQIFAIKFDEN
ncbi:MAG: HPr family phosphocarrier protein [candidate division Zixibacteria bacterium]|nr:HPr family phosphocarrier protein [candidate division Zixibacteria bacterium]